MSNTSKKRSTPAQPRRSLVLDGPRRKNPDRASRATTFNELEMPIEDLKKQCIDSINASLSSWSQNSCDYLIVFVENITKRDIIYWVQRLCPNREKSLALGKRGLEGLDQAKCHSANFNDHILKPIAESLLAKKVYCNIQDGCKRDAKNCKPAMPKEAERLAKVICVTAKLAHQKKANSSFRTAVGNQS
jgi:hypothetical protein